MNTLVNTIARTANDVPVLDLRLILEPWNAYGSRSSIVHVRRLAQCGHRGDDCERYPNSVGETCFRRTPDVERRLVTFCDTRSIDTLWMDTVAALSGRTRYPTEKDDRRRLKKHVNLGIRLATAIDPKDLRRCERLAWRYGYRSLTLLQDTTVEVGILRQSVHKMTCHVDGEMYVGCLPCHYQWRKEIGDVSRLPPSWTYVENGGAL